MLEGVLRALRARLGEVGPSGPVFADGCLTFGRARALALDPERMTAQEQSHLETCRRCLTLLTSFLRDLPHLPYWVLLRKRLNLLSPQEQRWVEYHLVSGGCRKCRNRDERVAGSPNFPLLLPAPRQLPHPAEARAAVPEPEVLVRGKGENLEAELVLDRDQLSLEIRTRAEALHYTLVTYAFQDATGEALLDGYAVLGPDVDGWFSAEIPLNPRQFREEVFKMCRHLALAAVLPGGLSDEEWRAVEAAAPTQAGELQTRSAWQVWASRTLLSGASLSEAAIRALSHLADIRA